MLGGIIAEFNPFHNGHKYLIDKARENCDEVMVVMSPNVCQRGEFAIYDKFSRARAAVAEGADLVVELPSAAAISAAPDFAACGTELLLSAGIDALVFGTECGSEEELFKIKDELYRAEREGVVASALKEGKSYPKTLAETLNEDVLTPNNILAIEYLKHLPDSVKIIAVPRVGAEHDSEEVSGVFASASAIREMDKDSAKGFIPEKAFSVFSECEPFPKEYAETLMFSYLKRLSAEEIDAAPGVSEGLENRIKDALSAASDMDELKALIKTKRYTMARIRRILLSLYLGIKKGEEKPQYIRVLAFNDKGREILSRIKKTSRLPVITALSDARKISSAAQKQAEKESFCTDIYNLCSKRGCPDGEDYRYSPVPMNKQEKFSYNK